MSETAQNNKADTKTSATKAKVEKEPRHLQTFVAVDADFAGPAPDELWTSLPGGVATTTDTSVLNRGPSIVAQRQPTTGIATAAIHPVSASAFAGKNFAAVPTRTDSHSTVQTKLTVGAAHDPYEEEADQVAEQVMRMPTLTFAAPASPGAPAENGRSVQRTIEEEEDLQTKPIAASITLLAQRTPLTSDEDQAQSVAQRATDETEEEELQTKRISAADSFETNDAFEDRVAATRGGGSPLPASVRSFMEPRFGADFSGVRLHAGSEAADLNRQVSAQAFTLGSDIYLGAGKVDVTSDSGKHLLAHELTHVVQQGGAVARKPIIRREVEPTQEEPPLSLEAAVAQAETEVSEAEVEQEAVELDATPIELPADNQIEGAAASAEGGAASTPAEATASVPQTIEPAASATDVAGPLAETATPVLAATEAVATASALPSETASASTEALAATATATEPALAIATAPNPETTSAPSATPIEPAAAVEPAAPIEPAATPTAATTAEAKSQATPTADVEPATPIEPAAASTAVSNAEAKTPSTPTATAEPATPIEPATQTPIAPTDQQTTQSPAATSSTSAAQPETVKRPEDEDEKLVQRSRLQRIIQRVVAVAPRSPAEDSAFQQVAARSKVAAQHEKTHEPAAVAATEAQAAADPKGKDVEMAAQSRQVGEMRAQPTGAFNPDVFKQKLFEKIKDTAPQNLKEADEFKKNNKLSGIKQSVSGEVKQQKEQAEGALEDKAEQAPDKSGIPAKEVKGLERSEAGPQPPDIGAPGAAPKPRTNAEVATPLQEQSATLDQQMAQGGVTAEQLENSNEPAFQQALKEKQDAQENAQTAPGVYRQDEQALLSQAQTQAQSTAETKSQETRSEKEQLLAQVFGLQGQTKGADESKRQAVSAHIADLYLTTKKDVETILNGMDGEVDKRFSSGADAAKQAFEAHVDRRMSKYKWDRYLSSWDGPALWIRDQFAGLPAEVNVFYVEGRQLYLAKMDACLTGIANYVAAELTRAKQRIAAGQQTIGKYVAGLSPELQQVGREAAQQIQGKFNELGSAVDNKQEDLIDSLAQSYHEKLQEVDSHIEQMKQENSGLVNKAAQAIGGVIKTIQELGQLLASALQRAAGAIGMILKDPIKFLGNLIKGVAQGLQNFGANILTHLQTGLIGWLTGSLGGMITAFPKSFTDLPGILSMVLEILGLTYAQIRGKVVKAIGAGGETAVNALEKAWEIFQIIRTQGLGGLWEFIKDMIGDLKAMVIDQIQSILVNEVIQAGIQWIVSLLGGPAGAFVKAVQAIIKIVTWFVNNASRLLAFVNSVLDSIVSIASGDVGGAAKYIENTLAKALPLVIGFLAELLGLGSVARKVQGIIAKIRAPIDKAITWIVKKAVAMAKKILAKLSGKGKKEAPTGSGTPGQLEDKVIGKEEAFSDGKESHRLWIELKGDTPTLMVASTPRTLLDFLESKEVKELDDPEGHVAQAKALMPQTTREAKEVVQALTQNQQDKAEASDRQTEQDMERLAPHLQWIFKNVSDKSQLIELAVSSMGIVQFMKSMARGETVMGVARQDFDSIYNDPSKLIGKKTVARKWLQDKFRAADSGKHEWIPTDMIDRVVKRAASSDQFVEGAKWIDLQHKLRVDTSWVIFRPSMWAVTTYRNDMYLVPDGHSGALSLGKSIQNSGSLHRGQEDFHNELRAAFNRAASIDSYFAELRKVIDKWLWQGETFSPALVPFIYYQGAPINDEAQFAQMHQQHYTTLINDLGRIKADVLSG